MVGAEQPGRGRVPVAAVPVVEDAVCREQPQYAVEGIGIDLARSGYVGDRYRAVSHAVGDTEVATMWMHLAAKPEVDSLQMISCSCSVTVVTRPFRSTRVAGRRRSSPE